MYIDPERPDIEKINQVASLVREGSIVALPTETVYGLAANMNRPEVIERLYRIKGRSYEKSFTIHIGNPGDIDLFIESMPAYGYRLIEAFWPGPLTIVYYKKGFEDTVGIRCPDHPVTSQVLRKTFCKVVMPSANVSGQSPALTPKEVESIFGDEIDLIVHSALPRYKISSTIVDITKLPMQILRTGAIKKPDIERVIKTRRLLFVCTGNTCRSVMAEYLIRDRIKKHQPDMKDQLDIRSCGIYARPDDPASFDAAQVLLEHGINCSGHKATTLTRYLIASSDIIIVMEKRHRDVIVGMDPVASAKTFLLGDFLPGSPLDIADPIGASREVFKNTCNQIGKAVKEIIDWLKL